MLNNVMIVLHRTMFIFCLLFAVFRSIDSARANIAVHFYSSEWGDTYPHAFVVFNGRLAVSGKSISANYGFTAARVMSTILRQPTPGYVQRVSSDYIAKAHRHFTLRINDQAYGKLMARIALWQKRRQPSYDLNRANCVHFVMELAEVAGLRVNRASQFFKLPRRFLDEVRALNPVVK